MKYQLIPINIQSWKIWKFDSKSDNLKNDWFIEMINISIWIKNNVNLNIASVHTYENSTKFIWLKIWIR